MIPSPAGLTKAVEFFSAAFSPALTYENTPPDGTVPLLFKVFQSLWQTVLFATAAVGIAFAFGVLLAFPASSAWWADDPIRRQATLVNRVARWLRTIVLWAVRSMVVLARSIHELLWAVLFLSAFGFNSVTAVLAIAIPYTEVFAKIFSEIIDKSPRDAAHAMRAAGAHSTAVFVFGLLPQAVPDMVAYACYRWECGMRSSAVMGFFGIPTIGYYLKPAFDGSHYHEVWTYLYGLMALVLLVDWWSGMMRKRLMS